MLTCVETTTAGGYEATPYVHRESTQAFYVLAGAYLVLVGEKEVACGSGSDLPIPPGTTHGYRATSTGG